MNSTKVCTKCQLEQPFVEFNKRRVYKGVQKYNPKCRTCSSAISKGWRKTKDGKISTRTTRVRIYEDTKDFLASLKENKPCVDCGKIFDSCAMDFDHIRGEKIANLSQMVYYGKTKILEELEKCEIVCAVCHRLRTKNRRILATIAF